MLSIDVSCLKNEAVKKDETTDHWKDKCAKKCSVCNKSYIAVQIFIDINIECHKSNEMTSDKL